MSETVNETMGPNAMTLGPAAALPVSHSHLQPSQPDDEEPMPSPLDDNMETIDDNVEIEPNNVFTAPPLETDVNDDDNAAPPQLGMSNEEITAAFEGNDYYNSDCCENFQNVIECLQTIIECLQCLLT